ncbi:MULTISPECIES: hypothetical protein [Pseudomonas syringae group]|uniref:hypothetical protein n=1 Tax=Pseudomonas syringae group TaxID=136849 RepID=UPI0006B8AC19|nr:MULTISPECIES: hypothetical protein [Pseudomonas syringae group]MBI6847399.1 hypothetical protein [Pseudomonas syringae]MBX6509444.1 hypothetical protein [Pseudomonas syringae pv. tomato]TES58929.1 hypothetical protein E2N91_11840 [Pseudomonas syringae pv. tomato]TES79757.1 hypothetical protein E2N89_06005 [Pseudomonas syringae pv. tomato]
MLAIGEVVEGSVAILDAGVLLENPGVHHSHSGDIGSKRPFLCVKVDQGNCYWVYVTTQFKEKRLCIDPWKVPGSPEWMSTSQYINDARKIFWGPAQVFIDASRIELPHYPHLRPSVTIAGVNKVIAEIRKYNRNLV